VCGKNNEFFGGLKLKYNILKKGYNKNIKCKNILS
jgi:hypothetical protein